MYDKHGVDLSAADPHKVVLFCPYGGWGFRSQFISKFLYACPSSPCRPSQPDILGAHALLFCCFRLFWAELLARV
jgi:hypothetical protein